MIGKFRKNFNQLWEPPRILAVFAAACLAPLIMLATAESPARAATTVNPLTTPWIRANAGLNHLRADPKGRYLAFVDGDGKHLSIVDIKTKNIFEVTKHFVGPSFFWSPDGFRLFFREQLLTVDKKVGSRLKVYDTALNRAVTLDELNVRTGILTFDPRDLRMHLLSSQGIRTKRIYFPDERLARWQVQQRSDMGKFLASQNGVLWVTQSGYAMRRLDDDGSPLESFDIAPDGSAIAWATKAGKIWISKEGKTPKLIGDGRDPQWHPTRPLLLFAGGRMVGNRIVNFDLRVTDTKGSGRFLTRTQHSDERWPQWHPKGHKIIYTMSRTTDVYLLDFKP